MDVSRKRAAWRNRLHEIIFEADTRAGLAFDVGLLAAIVASVAVVMLSSVPSFGARYGQLFFAFEWGFTLLFTLEYVLRLLAVERPGLYARSFFGIVDLVSILPTFLGLFLGGSHALLMVRVLRLIRIFRIFKLSHYLAEGETLMLALQRSQQKITVFLTTILASVVVMGSIMFVVEGPEHGFTSIPVSVYWAIVTVTTVGYGDIAPKTIPGQVIASVAMILGYAILAVPTGIVTVELTEARRRAPITTQACTECGAEGHDHDARYCKFCGAGLHA